VPAPQQLDFVALRDGVIRNNVGVDRIVVVMKAKADNGRVVAQTTQQSWILHGAPNDVTGPWLWLAVEDLDAVPSLRFLGASASPTERPASLPESAGKR
jgi:hypothetical protein